MGSVASGCKRRKPDIKLPEQALDEQQHDLDPWSPKKDLGDVRKTLLKLLISGGDERLVIDPATGLNKYNSSVEPIDETAIVRSSCTANPVTPDLFEFAEQTVKELTEEAKSGRSESDIFEKYMFNLRKRLRQEWNLDDDISSSLVSSGTDAELLPIMFGVLRAQRAREDEDEQCDVISVLTAAGEVGTNTKMAATGKVCGDILPVQQLKPLQGTSSQKVAMEQPRLGDNVFPLFGTIQSIDVPLRDDISGALVTPEVMDAKITQIVTTAAQSGTYKAVLLHMVISCKTGHCVPSVNCVQKLAAEFPEVVPVVDACQMRGLTAYSIRRLTKLGFIVMSTGSKFYGGPPFSGAVFFPQKYTEEMEEHLANSVACRSCISNSLLSGYICSSTLSTDFKNLRSLLQQSPNFGLALRWSMALRNISEYHKIPEPKREDIIVNWAGGVRKLIRAAPDFIQLLDKTADEAIVDEAPENQVFGIGLPRTGTHSIAEALKLIGMTGMNRCLLTLSRVKHVAPDCRRVIGNFDVDNSSFRTYQKIFQDNPSAKFILTTRDDEAYKQSVERWNEKNQDRDDMKDVPTSTSQFQNEVTEFFVHRRAAHRLLVIDVFKMTDEELWTKMVDFVSPTSSHGIDRFDPIAAGVPFPRAVVQVAGNLTKGNDSQVIKTLGDGTSPNDLELLTGQVNTIIPIVLEKKVLSKSKGYRFERLHLDELKRLHLLLALDCSVFTPPISGLSSEQEAALARRCFIAQPVSLNLTTWGRAAYLGVLRFSLGATSITEAVKRDQGAVELLEQDKVVMQKLEVLLTHWDATAKWDVHLFNNKRLEVVDRQTS